jgi:hypothetical protein
MRMHTSEASLPEELQSCVKFAFLCQKLASRIALGAVASGLVACAAERDTQSLDGRVTEDAQETSLAQYFERDVPEYATAIQSRIDGYGADLTSIHGVSVSSNGRVAVVQQQDGAVAVVDSVGGVHRVGRKGDGPGEFRTPYKTGWLADTLWVADFGTARVTLFTPALEVVRTIGIPGQVSLDATRTANNVSVVAVLGGDTILATAQLARQPRVGGAGVYMLIRATKDGSAAAVAEWAAADMSVYMSRGSGYVGVGVPFAIDVLTNVSPDGKRFAVLETVIDGPDGGLVHLRVIDNRGRELIDRSFPFAGIRIPDADIEAAIRAIGVRRPNSPANRPQLAPDVARQMRTLVRAKIPPVRSPVRSIVIGIDGRIWLQPRLEQEGLGIPWLVLDGQGRPEGRTRVPSGSKLQAATSVALWVVDSDSLDVESLVEYRLVRSR